MNRARWKVGVGKIAVRDCRINPANPIYGDKPESMQHWIDGDNSMNANSIYMHGAKRRYH